MADSLIAGALINAVAAAVFVFVGLRFARNPWPEHARWAGRAFVGWWLGFAGYLLLWITLPMLLVSMGYRGLSVFMILLYASMFSLSLGVGCLVYYLLYLFTGRKGLWGPVALWYAGVFVALMTIFTVHGPEEVAVHEWWVDLKYSVPLGTAFQVSLGALVLPSTLGALGYLTLVRRTPDPHMRFRIVAVSLTIVVWGLAGAMARVLEADLLQLVLRSVVGLMGALLILAAYQLPERADRRREHGKRIREKQARLERLRQQRERALARRMDDLV
jgi:hypothetical protein